MPKHFKTARVAVVQGAPVLFDREATVEKTCRLIQEAAAEGAKLILFPEAFIPAYPRGFSFGMVVGSRTAEGRLLWERYWANAVTVPGPATHTIGAAAKQANAMVAIGVIERDGDLRGECDIDRNHDRNHDRNGGRNGGTLFCSLLYFGPDGSLLGKHRKLKPTGSERLIWGEGDGSTLTVVESEFGPVGGLICWENYMPLARMALYGKGVDIYLAPTADARDTWQATLQHIAGEGRCFVLGCNQFVTKGMHPADLPCLHELDAAPEIMCRGGSAIVSPMGEVIAGPLYGQEGILYADLDMGEVVRGRLDFDVVGHYARPDVFELRVNEAERPGVEFGV